ncbi:MAG: ATP-binding protein [Phycisphaerae bacterium]|nr:ATP-binding protein [Phycisphaerae bacterium]
MNNFLVMLVILALVGTFTYYRLDANYQRQTRQDQQRLARISAEHFHELWPLEPAKVDAICKKLLHDPASRLTVIAADGTVLGDSRDAPRNLSNHKTDDRPEILAALDGQEGWHERISETWQIPYRYVAVPLTREGAVVGAVRVAMPVKAIAEGESLLFSAVFGSALAVAAAAVGLALLTSWLWYAPLRRVTETAKKLASGDLSRATTRSDGQLADLTDALNGMRDNIGKYLARIAAQHQDFQTVLAAMQEGVIATDADGTVVLTNSAAADMLRLDPHKATSQPLSTLLPMQNLLELLAFHERARTATTPIRTQLELHTPTGLRTIEVHGIKVTPGESDIVCLLVLRDVTDTAAMNAMKAQFVANASHELRTPVATLRAAVDSLGEADSDDERQKLASILDRHIARLEDMTNDLLDLHRVESARFAVQWQDIPVNEFAEWLQGQFAWQAQEKGVTMTVSTSTSAPALATSTAFIQTIRSDRKLLEMIARNLVDNALKFTAAGGHVECTIDVNDSRACLRVRDTGCGIAPADQPRVFDRFFQGDASRTGDGRSRGTGLGLAIVKHATERLAAAVTLHSEVGKGTTVTVTLPQETNDAGRSHGT